MNGQGKEEGSCTTALKLLSAFCLLPSALLILPLSAATNSETAGEIPVLHPPHAEIPPTFREQYGGWVVAGGVLLAGLGGVAFWWLNRPKPPVLVPPEIEARRELERVMHVREDGSVLSHVSRTLRRYCCAVFDLPPGEYTTGEFCRMLSDHEPAGAELSGAIGVFLRQIDERKFAPSAGAGGPRAVPRALALIDLAEARRAQLRPADAAPTAGPAAVIGNSGVSG